MNKAHSRAWYYLLMEWIQFEELSDDALQSQAETEQPIPAPSSSALQQDSAESGASSKRARHDHSESGEANDSLEDDPNQLLDLRQTSFTAGFVTCPASDDIDDKCCICKVCCCLIIHFEYKFFRS